MATLVNVFGNPVTGETRMERATNALIDVNVDGKRDEAIAFVNQEKGNFGNGVSTLCFFYNASGETMFFDHDNSWYGRIYHAYPSKVRNGQWGAFLHVKKDKVASGSVGFAVYRVQYNDTDFCKQLLAWETPWMLGSSNCVYCDIFADGADINADDIYKKMESENAQQKTVMKMGIFTTTTIQNGTSPFYEASVTLADAAELAKNSQATVEA